MSAKSNTCPVCGAEDSDPIITLRGYTYWRCQVCEAAYLSPMPDIDVIKQLYQSESYFSGDGTVGYHDYVTMHQALHPLFRRRLSTLSRLFPNKGRLLDFGCADGYFLEMARQQGWEIAGVEVSVTQAARAASQLSIPVFSSIEHFPEASFDVITLWEVLEHLPQPVAELRKLKSRLRPGGTIMLSTPNAGFWKAIHTPGEWSNFSPPAHLILFTERALGIVLSDAELVPLDIRHAVPLPPLPHFIQRLCTPLERAISEGSAPMWPLSLSLWRAIRLFGWAWQKASFPDYNIFTSLEAIVRTA